MYVGTGWLRIYLTFSTKSSIERWALIKYSFTPSFRASLIISSWLKFEIIAKGIFFVDSSFLRFFIISMPLIPGSITSISARSGFFSDSLLILSKAQVSQKDLMLKKVSLNLIINKAIDKIAIFAKQKNTNIKQSISNITLNADEEKLVRLIVILLDNAIKYSKNGSTVIISVKRTDHKAKIEIKDNGYGISKEDLPFIFDRFYRADKSRSKTEGYGLGLSIAKKIVDLHKGSIYVNSTHGKGATFTILLPISLS